MVEEKIERIYTIPLGKSYEYLRTRRTPRAVKLLRQFVSRHMKADLGDVLISNKLNSHLWQHSIQRPPRRVKVRVVKVAGKVKIYLPDEMTDEERKAQKEKEAKEKADKAKKEKEEKEKTEKLKKEQEKKAESKKEAEKAEKQKEGKPSPAEKK